MTSRSFPSVLRHRRVLLLGLLAVVAPCLMSPGRVAGDDRVRLRVMSWNVWAIPTVSSYLEERVARMPQAIADHAPDIVLLQEVWEPEHAAVLARGLRAAGYPHCEHLYQEGGAKTGLFVASRFALDRLEFGRFTVGHTPHTPWHLDWMANKGVGRWIVTTSLGAVVVANTHMQAQYVTDTYDDERLAQAIEIALAAREPAGVAAIVGGDFNSLVHDAPRLAIERVGGFRDAAPDAGIDTVYVRTEDGIGVAIVAAREVLGDGYDLGGGVRRPLSDHPAVLVDLELSRCEGCLAPRADARLAALEAVLRAGASTRELRLVLARGAVVSVLLGAGLLLWWRRRRRSRRAVLQYPLFHSTFVHYGLIALCIVGAAWGSYLAVYYYPSRVQELTEVADRLRPP
jgi:endonuclease/exonuclease/phosphatase family metal-dependent hydrolase